MGFLRWLDDHFEEVLLVFFAGLMVIVIALQIAMRYIFNSSLSWSEELARYCFIWLVFIGVSLAVKRDKHMRVDVIFLVLKGKKKLFFEMLANVFFLFFTFIAIYYGYQITEKILTWGQTSPGLHLPMWLVYIAGPVGLGLTAIRLIQKLIQQGKNLLKSEVIN